MRGRVEELTGRCEDMWIMTFHAMCLRILRMHCERIGYGHNFVIYDGTDQKTIVKNILKEQNINDKEFSAPYLLSIISSCKEKAVTPEQYKADMEENFKTKIIYNVFQAYEEQLKSNNAMDFDDLLLNTVRLFEQDEAVLMKYQNRFRYIMVDEYQDTNRMQYRLVKMLAEEHHNLCVVGDDDQCIYQWRGADIRNILDFEKDFPEAKGDQAGAELPLGGKYPGGCSFRHLQQSGQKEQKTLDGKRGRREDPLPSSRFGKGRGGLYRRRNRPAEEQRQEVQRFSPSFTGSTLNPETLRRL